MGMFTEFALTQEIYLLAILLFTLYLLNGG